MLVTAKDLRFNISMLFKVLSKGEDVTITYRGKPKAKLISYDEGNEEKDSGIFGMWDDKTLEVDEFVRDLRRGRSFDL
ncbi:MAG TPA: type II toxin-antitoxin system prevent-host-death family antitoxin [Sulfurospirillum arcachonense]|nr:type II toxin-antitoxin system prevent-host-death family antitoxin [Sulfurospirillum arcachonense]HIP45376.1 type II toxin-antitoxin system prevent-host-death family antitoxin [Sulfurospirillum arcachonense]